MAEEKGIIKTSRRKDDNRKNQQTHIDLLIHISLSNLNNYENGLPSSAGVGRRLLYSVDDDIAAGTVGVVYPGFYGGSRDRNLAIAERCFGHSKRTSIL